MIFSKITWLQGTFLTEKRRLKNRRIDWLLWILLSQVAEAFTVRSYAQADGSVLNHKAHKAMNAAILKANKQPDNVAKFVSEHRATVRSATDSGVEHDVLLPCDEADELTCSCQASRFKTMCWHVVKVLKRKGATENLLLRHMGILHGSVHGGYHKLMAAMQAAAAMADAAATGPEAAACPAAAAAAAADRDALEDNPFTADEVTAEEAPPTSESDAEQPGPSVQRARHQPERSGRSEAEAALA